ncbi:adenylate kinase, chloroplastic-like isoform X3 [Iris pallida]|uniref:adenylate kinase n=1 Tax=Iris pallida TaxID=29817 RepID=A0AAX6FIZ7_IRIPA|nr:adenylate kinase, chloroplastic-like isoform X3 [Iris pallida]
MSLLTSLSYSPPPSALGPSSSSSSNHHKPISDLHYSSSSYSSVRTDGRSRRRLSTRFRRSHHSAVARSTTITAAVKPEPLKIMISGAPASGKGTQCELIKEKYGLVHISAGDLLRAEVASGTENGKRAKENMEKGMLVPDEIVVMMVKERLLQPDAQESGWLLDGYPRSLSQAKALEDLHIRPDLFILLDVSEDALIERVVGRRLDPVTEKIYHLKYSPPENEKIASRLTQRFDDTEEKVKLRLQTHHRNVEAVLSVYKDLIFKVDGNAPKENVFTEIDGALSSVLEQKSGTDSASVVTGMASLETSLDS